jgi:HSP20 family protein
MPMDAVRKEDHVELHFDLPGVAPESIELTVEKNVLTVKAERAWWPGDQDQILARERVHGTYTRQVMLGEALDTDRVEASYDQGVLTVRVPVAEKAKPRKVEIALGRPEAIEVGRNG